MNYSTFPVAFLTCLFITCLNIRGEEIWRYSSSAEQGKYEFTTKHSITVEYFGSQPTQWCHSHGCSINQSSLPVTRLQCEEAGYHAISPVGNATLVRHIEVTYSPFCYKWYYFLETSDVSGKSGVLRLWVINELYASDEELNDTATHPSLFSRRLTTILDWLGQAPSIRLTSGDRYTEQPLQYHNSSFNPTLSCWEYDGFSFTHHSVLWITGKSAALLGCFIGPRRIQLMATKPALSMNDALDKVPLQGHGQASRIIKDPCAPNVAVRLGQGMLLVTQDNFRTTSGVYVPHSVLQGDAPMVRDVTFSSRHLVVVLESGAVLSISSVTPDTVTRSSGLTGIGISRLSQQNRCFEGEKSKVPSEVVIAWSNQEGNDRAFICNSDITGFRELAIPWSAASSDWSIHDVVVHSFFPSVFALVTDGTQALVLEYDYYQETWREYSIAFTPFTAGSSLAMTFLPSATHFLLVWNTSSIYYGKLNGDGVSLVVRQGGVTSTLSVGNASISSVTIGGSDGYAVLLSNNKMFYGRLGLEYLVEIHPGESSTADLAVMFDLLAGLLLVTNDSSVDSVKGRYLPLKNEAMNALYPDTECPYIRFTSNVSHELLYVEKRQSVSVWISLVYQQAQDNDITHEVFGSSLELSSTKRVDYYPGKVIINKTFTFSHKNRNQTSLYKSKDGMNFPGPLSVTFFPKKVSVTCEQPYQMTMLIHVGCSPNLHLRIRNCSSSLTTGNTSDSIASRYKNLVQCALSAGVDENFILTVDLYDGEQFMTEVTYDYVLRENNGRQGYGYTGTMAQAGCVRNAQTWATIIATNGSWHQNNYKSCFVDDGLPAVAFDGSQPYEVINSTGVSHVTFSEPGQYEFTLTLLDPRVSFCSLDSRFIVDVAPGEGKKDFMPQLVSMIVVMIVSGVMLCVSFLLYRKHTLGEHEQDRRLAERLQQLRSIYKGARMSIAAEEPLTVGRDARRSTVGGNRPSIRRATGTAELLALAPKRSSRVTQPSSENMIRPEHTIEEELEPDD